MSDVVVRDVVPSVVTRRTLLRGLGLGAAAVGAAPLLSACSGGLKTGSSGGGAQSIKIGYVSPRTGAYAAFAESDGFILDQARTFFGKGLQFGGTTYHVEILDRDTGSDPAQAATIASDLIANQGVDLMLVTSTPETIHPVSSKCEREGVPCLSTIEPWQAFFFGQNATPDKPFTYSYHFFDGIDAVATVEADIWDLSKTNNVVGVLWPNDSDGSAFRAADTGYAAQLKGRGYTFVDPGAYEDGTKDFSAIISTMKDKGVEILAGVPTPPDFATFWTQAAQQGFRPKVATIAKAILFESSVSSLPNNLGNGLAFASWWVPSLPYKSSLTGQTAQQVADAYEASAQANGKKWNQGLGPNYALFEVANAVLTKTNPKDKKGVAAQIGNTKAETLFGTIDWTASGAAHPVKNVAANSMFGTQWVGSGGQLNLSVVSNKDVPDLKLDGNLAALS